MKCKWLFLLIILFSHSCKKVKFTIDKTPYWGDELRLNGYYYNNDDSYTDIICLYRDGALLHCQIDKKRDVKEMDKEFINFQTDNQFKYRIDWGCFFIEQIGINYEYHYSTGCFYKISQSKGTINNDSTFIITHFKMRNTDKKFEKTSTKYLFREFLHKPDSSHYNKW